MRNKKSYFESKKTKWLTRKMTRIKEDGFQNNRTNYAKDISALVVENYGSKVRIFENSIPMSVRAAEISAEGVSIYEHDPNGKVASAYQSLTEEVLADE